MLQLVRGFVSSKVGAAIALLLLLLIAFAFAAGDVAGLRSFGGNDSSHVATVGKVAIDATTLSQSANNAVENLKQENPRLSMKSFLAEGGLDKVLDELLSRTALSVFGQNHGIVAGTRLVDSEITKIPAFRGIDGKFSETAFRQLLAQRGISEKAVREDLAQGLIARQILEPASFGATMPRELAMRYAALLKEKRSGAIALLPSPAFAPKTPPSDKELADFYAAHRNQFIRPERRVIRYASFGDEVLKNLPAPSEAEIAAFYAKNRAQYTAVELRRLTQLIVPTEPAARAVAAEVAKGKTLEAAAAEKGLSVSKMGPIEKGALAQSASQAVADAGFAAASGAIAAPARSAIGWHVLRVDGVDKRPEKTLDQARPEIAAQLGATKRRDALVDLTAKIEEEFENGGNLADIARDRGLTLKQTPPLTADGKSYANPSEPMPPELAKVVSTAFQMEERKPQIAEVDPNKTFVIFDVSQIAASAPAPLAEIKNDVLSAYLLDKGSAAAKAAGEKLAAATRGGKSLAEAAAALKLPMPPVQPVEMNRQDLTAQGRTPGPPLILLFSMARGTTKLLPIPGNRGWFVVSLKDITMQPLAADDPIVPQAQRELGQLAGAEYADSLRRAIRAEVTVKRNEAAVQAVRTQLGGGE
jgi:peptidyl-prolyl cis-trans isomerase D